MAIPLSYPSVERKGNSKKLLFFSLFAKIGINFESPKDSKRKCFTKTYDFVE